MSCRRCAPRGFSADAVLEWTYRGSPAAMHPHYLAELARIRALAPADGAARRTADDLAVGERVRLLGGGRYAGLVGTAEGRGRTRWKVRTRLGLVTAPRALIARLDAD